MYAAADAAQSPLRHDNSTFGRNGAMNRNAKTLLASLSMAVVFLVVIQVAWAQSQLERLEQQIRQRNAQPTAADNSAAKGPPPSPVIINATIGGTSAHVPVYLGATADDQHDRGRGVRIVAVHPGGPAARAGLRRQDLITAITGIRVRQMSDLSDILDTFSPGQVTTFDILRDDKKQTLKVTFARRPAEAKTAIAIPQPPTPQLGNRPEPLFPPTQPPPITAKGQAETIPSPSAELLPEPPEQPAGPMLESPKKLAPPTKAEAARDESHRLDQLQRRVDELERRIAELERALAKASK
jgi:uncharacterized coiled-coil protein SlyX